MAKDLLIRAEKLTKHYRLKTQTLYAVNELDFEIYRGETLGLVGESGCGKSTTGKVLLHLVEPTSGTIHFDGIPLHEAKPNALKKLRRDLQLIFQDPYSSLNPRMTIEDIIGEGIEIHRTLPLSLKKEKVEELLSRVGLSGDALRRYPHEFSGGQRQRIGIARALALQPKFIVCDEPLSALDLSVQAQVVALLLELQKEFNLTYLFISHNLALVRYLAHRVGVMYLGKIVELASTTRLYTSPLHPYTQALLSSVPIADPLLEKKRSRIVLQGEVPSPLQPPQGCVFQTRCPHAMPHCAIESPQLLEAAPGHSVACHLFRTP